jgi:hypothetical protein
MSSSIYIDTNFNINSYKKILIYTYYDMTVIFTLKWALQLISQQARLKKITIHYGFYYKRL